jgi:hypothetical protein
LRCFRSNRKIKRTPRRYHDVSCREGRCSLHSQRGPCLDTNQKQHCGFPEFVWIWNKFQGLTTPPLHLRIARWLANRRAAGDRELLLMAFRNSGKSTIVGLFAAWLLLRDSNTRILVIAAEFTLAKKMVRNVKRIIERHPCTQHLKPGRADQWASDQFTVCRTVELRDPSMLAKGIGANVTGLRADVIICDDVEVPNTCDTAAKRADLRARLQDIEYVLIPGGLQLFVGTPHSYYSIYAAQCRSEIAEERAFLEGFRRLELPLLDTEGNSLWPERFPLAKIDGIRRRSGPSKFESQMMLRPRNLANGRLDPDALRHYEAELHYSEGNHEATLTLEGRRLISASCWWDPSYGAPDKGDASVVATVFTDDHGDYWLHRICYLKHDPALAQQVDEATQLCRQVAAFARELYLPAVTIETNGLGRFLPGLLRREIAGAGMRCAVIEKVASRQKDLRIIDAFEAVLAAGRLHAHTSVFATPFAGEMRDWQPGGKGRDDGLDAVAGCLLNEPVRLYRQPPDANTEIMGKWRHSQSVIEADTDFPV